jgi:hypothetical protein
MRMQAIIRNLGPVREATVDLKPLTIFIGKNNTGKTWTAYLLASALSSLGLNKFLEAYTKGDFRYEEVDDALEAVVKEGTAVIDLQELIQKRGSQFLNDLASLAPRWIGDFLGTSESFFEGLQLQLDPQQIMDEWSDGIQNYGTVGVLSFIPPGKGTLHARKDRGNATMKFYTLGRDVETELPSGDVWNFATGGIFLVLHRTICPRVVFLPSERIAYADLALFDSIKVKTGETGVSMDRPEMGSIHVRHPLNDLMNMIAWIVRGSLPSRKEDAKREPRVEKYLEMADLLRREMLGGDLRLVQSDPELKASRVVFQPEGAEGRALEIPATSSLVKALSPLYLYLTYVARPGDLLVIDEPEMNLHPEAQAKITELLAILVNSGIRVIATTHSPYIVDHLINLMKAAKLERAGESAEKLYLKTPESFIPQEMVSVYLFESGTAARVVSEEGMIDWGTFGDVSERLSETYFQI